MIQKVIHYCWFGDKKMSSLELRCIDSWNKYLPDYSLKCWNEDNFDINYCRFSSIAYSQKKYAFVADVARFYALLQEGGLYLDTDMLFLKSLPEDYLKYDFFLGKENENSLSAGVIGASPSNGLVEEILNYYQDIEFGKKEILIPHVLNQLLCCKGELGLGGYTQRLILEPAVFYPLPYEKRHEDWKPWVSDQTVAVHLWEGSWIDYSIFELVRMRRFKRAFFRFVADYRSGLINMIYLKRLIYVFVRS